ncbi:amidase domain-containing protein [Bacillus sp. FJAT-49736]|uniref:amidase domain-containing protein n=1 Tax=Bacillus sp. FJAT-49736 TaxID=2833582 RepID=UPI001BC95491|nr:amidase domain-containing protein [Bacillus sp. FJAT-49736]MBS4171696.1 amidase domain-containing protein [Bacillus sp. FJAT-49736]
MKSQLQEHLQSRLEQVVHKGGNDEKINRKKELMSKRNAEIVKVQAQVKIKDKQEEDNQTYLQYLVHLQYLIKQKDKMYMEEEMETRKATFFRERLYDDHEIFADFSLQEEDVSSSSVVSIGEEHRKGYTYDRLRAVQYAERWWNSYNPKYRKFDVDCTNFISQCLHEGGAPMRGYPNRGQGWWMQNNNYSYSWAAAHSLMLYLSNSKSGLRAKQVSSPDELNLGDVICLDFQGDGRFDHNTIVTGKDAFGMPLVNAHTYNSRMRYWAYEDSSAYTPNIKYKFFTIVDG